MHILNCSFALALLASVPCAFAQGVQRAGYVISASGAKCAFNQRFENESGYFHGSLKGKRGVISFNDPGCMKADSASLDINKMMINNTVGRWYSHADANFLTRAEELFRTSELQSRGQCIQSQRYPTIGITVDYVIQGGAIVEVSHGPAVMGCKR